MILTNEELTDLVERLRADLKTVRYQLRAMSDLEARVHDLEQLGPRRED